MNKLPPLKTLPAFLAVARHLSFSKAGEELHVTHSAISQGIRLLESFLGQQLFKREANKVFLTPEGEKYYYAINTAMNIISEATPMKFESANNILTVNMLPTLAVRWFMARLLKFQSKHPKIELRLSTSGNKEIDFSKNAIDIAVVYGQETDWAGLQKDLLFSDSIFPVCSPSILEKISVVNFKEKLNDFKFIYVTAELRKKDWSTWFKAAKITEPPASSRIYFQDTIQALQAAHAGLGIAIAHEPFVFDDIKLKQLVAPLDIKVKLTESYYLVYPKSSLKQEKVKKFRKWILDEI